MVVKGLFYLLIIGIVVVIVDLIVFGVRLSRAGAAGDPLTAR